jgi:hypothetical protein
MMTSYSFPAKEAQGDTTTVPNWLELPKEVTANILQRLGTIDIVTSACLVCPQWWNICKDPFMWRTIQITNTLVSPYSHVELADMSRYAIERSCGHLENIHIDSFCTDHLLECIAEK